MERKHMKLPENQIALLKRLAGLGKKVIAVLNGGSSIEMPWENCCAAIVHGYLGGQAGAGAMLKVLTGQVNPSGKLNETYPVSYEDTPALESGTLPTDLSHSPGGYCLRWMSLLPDIWLSWQNHL